MRAFWKGVAARCGSECVRLGLSGNKKGVLSRDAGLLMVSCVRVSEVVARQGWIPVVQLLAGQEGSEERRVGNAGRARWSPYP